MTLFLIIKMIKSSNKVRCILFTNNVAGCVLLKFAMRMRRSMAQIKMRNREIFSYEPCSIKINLHSLEI